MIRSLFIYLLILSFPVQSFAGAAMLHCGSVASVKMDHHHHHYSETQASPQMGKLQTDNSTQIQTPMIPGSCTCGTCQDCCYHGTATAPVSALYTTFALSIQAVLQVNDQFILYLPSYRLDRPPRHFSI